jgi:hypothetical protein
MQDSTDLAAGADLGLHGDKKSQYIRNLTRLRKMLKEDSVKVSPEAALTILTQCQDTGLQECVPGVNCPDLDLLRNSSDPEMRAIFNTRAFRDGKAWQCVPKNLIMSGDKPEDPSQLGRFNRAVSRLSKEMKNISNIQRWRGALEKKYCSVIDKDLLRGDGDVICDEGDDNCAPDDNLGTRNAADLCGRARGCTWLPEATKTGDLVAGNVNTALDGKCVPTLDSLAAQLREEADRLYALTGGKDKPAVDYATAKKTYINALAAAGIMGADTSTGKFSTDPMVIDPDTGDVHMEGLVTLGPMRPAVEKAYATFRAARATATEYDMIKGSGTGNLADTLRDRYLNAKTFEDTDAICQVAGGAPNATVGSCSRTSIDPDGRLYQDPTKDRLCGVVDPGTGRIRPYNEGDKDQKLAENEQCRFQGGEGMTWATEQDATTREYVTKSLRTNIKPEYVARLSLRARGNGQPTDVEVQEEAASIKLSLDGKKELLQQVAVKGPRGRGALKGGGQKKISGGSDSLVNDLMGVVKSTHGTDIHAIDEMFAIFEQSDYGPTLENVLKGEPVVEQQRNGSGAKEGGPPLPNLDCTADMLAKYYTDNEFRVGKKNDAVECHALLVWVQKNGDVGKIGNIKEFVKDGDVSGDEDPAPHAPNTEDVRREIRLRVKGYVDTYKKQKMVEDVIAASEQMVEKVNVDKNTTMTPEALGITIDEILSDEMPTYTVFLSANSARPEENDARRATYDREKVLDTARAAIQKPSVTLHASGPRKEKWEGKISEKRSKLDDTETGDNGRKNKRPLQLTLSRADLDKAIGKATYEVRIELTKVKNGKGGIIKEWTTKEGGTGADGNKALTLTIDGEVDQVVNVRSAVRPNPGGGAIFTVNVTPTQLETATTFTLTLDDETYELNKTSYKQKVGTAGTTHGKQKAAWKDGEEARANYYKETLGKLPDEDGNWAKVIYGVNGKEWDMEQFDAVNKELKERLAEGTHTIKWDVVGTAAKTPPVGGDTAPIGNGIPIGDGTAPGDQYDISIAGPGADLVTRQGNVITFVQTPNMVAGTVKFTVIVKKKGAGPNAIFLKPIQFVRYMAACPGECVFDDDVDARVLGATMSVEGSTTGYREAARKWCAGSAESKDKDACTKRGFTFRDDVAYAEAKEATEAKALETISITYTLSDDSGTAVKDMHGKDVNDRTLQNNESITFGTSEDKSIVTAVLVLTNVKKVERIEADKLQANGTYNEISTVIGTDETDISTAIRTGGTETLAMIKHAGGKVTITRILPKDGDSDTERQGAAFKLRFSNDTQHQDVVVNLLGSIDMGAGEEYYGATLGDIDSVMSTEASSLWGGGDMSTSYTESQFGDFDLARLNLDHLMDTDLAQLTR